VLRQVFAEQALAVSCVGVAITHRGVISGIKIDFAHTFSILAPGTFVR
jgi:hypothetical protein